MDLLCYPDERVIARHAGLQVLAPRHEIMFRDGSAVHLHPVALAGQPVVPDPLLRAVQVEGLRWMVVDLRRLSTEIEDDLRRLEPRDRFGVVWFSLRGLFGSAAAFLDAAHHLHCAAWWPAPQREAA